jgi:hypothetical protein
VACIASDKVRFSLTLVGLVELRSGCWAVFPFFGYNTHGIKLDPRETKCK